MHYNYTQQTLLFNKLTRGAPQKVIDFELQVRGVTDLTGVTEVTEE